MNPKEYIELCSRTKSDKLYIDKIHVDIIHGILGCVTESGELEDHLKRVLFYGTEVDKVNILEELGDLSWYISLLLNVLDSSWEEIWSMNISKLKSRFPEKFTENKAVNRDVKKERKILESNCD